LINGQFCIHRYMLFTSNVFSLLLKETCPPSSTNCYCPDIGDCEFANYTIPLNKLQTFNKHMGNHNRNYFFEITVTNHANLSTTEYIDVLVDNSPPETGVIYEG